MVLDCCNGAGSLLGGMVDTCSIVASEWDSISVISVETCCCWSSSLGWWWIWAVLVSSFMAMEGSWGWVVDSACDAGMVCSSPVCDGVVVLVSAVG